MSQVNSINIEGMTCDGCSNKVQSAINNFSGIKAVEVSHELGIAEFSYNDDSIGIPSRDKLVNAIIDLGYKVEGVSVKFNWSDKSVWRQSAHNTKWCLIGCSIGEFGTLAYYSISGITAGLELYSRIWYFYAILPLINGLITSIMLETAILIRGQMDFRNALSTALGMSFISMLMMEIAMEITDLLFTKGELGLMPIAIPFMLIVGFLTPWPYNYWRLKKYGEACH